MVIAVFASGRGLEVSKFPFLDGSDVTLSFIAFSITSATITDVLVSSEIKSEIYECRAVPLPLEINWRARQEGSTNSIALTNSVDGIEISSYNDNDEAISVLMIRISDGNNFQTIGCRVTENGAGRVITNNFERLASINGSAYAE